MSNKNLKKLQNLLNKKELKENFNYKNRAYQLYSFLLENFEKFNFELGTIKNKNLFFIGFSLKEFIIENNKNLDLFFILNNSFEKFKPEILFTEDSFVLTIPLQSEYLTENICKKFNLEEKKFYLKSICNQRINKDTILEAFQQYYFKKQVIKEINIDDEFKKDLKLFKIPNYKKKYYLQEKSFKKFLKKVELSEDFKNLKKYFNNEKFSLKLKEHLYYYWLNNRKVYFND